MNKQTNHGRAPTDWTAPAMRKRIAGRYAAERRFKALGLFAVLASVGFLLFLLVTMVGNGARGFTRTEVLVPVDLSAAMLPPADQLTGPDAVQALGAADIEGAVAASAERAFGPEGARLLSDAGWTTVRNRILDDPEGVRATVPVWIPAASPIDMAAKGDGDPASEAQVARLRQANALRTGFNLNFLTDGDATDPTVVGIWGALAGSLLTMGVTIGLAFPIGVLTAIYLEEYASRNRWTDIIEVSINNLAAVPSIIFGLLGLAVFLNVMHLPRSAPIVGGLTLALMTMPVIVIAGRNAIKSVPPSIRDAALGIGASPVQVVFHHVLPLALPGILTGTIIGMARALGETAPLLMIGMRAFIATPPTGITQPASVLPVQIFL